MVNVLPGKGRGGSASGAAAKKKKKSRRYHKWTKEEVKNLISLLKKEPKILTATKFGDKLSEEMEQKFGMKISGSAILSKARTLRDKLDEE